GGIADDSSIVLRAAPVVIIAAGVNMPLWHKYPPVGRTVIVANCYIDVDARRYWCPAVVATTIAPAYPCRPPCVARYPYPAIVVVISPVTIVERCPAPIVARYPCV